MRLIMGLGRFVRAHSVVPHVRARHETILAELDSHASYAATLSKLSRLEGPTHGHLPTAANALNDLRRLLAERGEKATEPDVRLSEALGSVSSLASEIRDTIPERRARKASGVEYGAVAAFADEGQASLTPPSNLYSDRASLHRSVHGRRPERWFLNLGGLIDDVRLLHDQELERVVLNLTLWARLVIVASAPLLVAVNFGRVPLENGFQPADYVWGLAVAIAAATAVLSPRIVRSVMRRDIVGAKTRARLLMVEVPIACALLLLEPCWATIVFAAGWMNWWQRPRYRWGITLIWLAICAGTLFARGLIWSPIPTAAPMADLVIAVVVIGVIGTSYGAMLPLSVNVPFREVRTRTRSRRLARDHAKQELNGLAEQLRFVAGIIDEQYAGVTETAIRAEAAKLRRVADGLEGASASWLRDGAVPAGLGPLLDSALAAEGPTSDLSRGRCIVRFSDEELADLRARRRSHARAIHRVIRQLAREAEQHGSGLLQTECSLYKDRIAFEVSNAVGEELAKAGWGTGCDRIRLELARIPGAKLDAREFLSSDRSRRFRVRFSIPAAAFS